MDNLQVLRYVTMLEQRLKVIENNGPNIVNNSVIPTDLSEVLARLAAVEARPVVDLNEVSARLAAVEARPVVDLNEVLARLAAVEARPELSQRLSALELAVTSQNP
jgi:hypothetical protein